MANGLKAFFSFLSLFLAFAVFLPFGFSPEISSCGAVASYPGTYVLSANVSNATIAVPSGYSACIKVNSSNVAIDCLGKSVTDERTGKKTFGIFIQGLARNVTVRNCPNISGFETGIYVSGAIDGGIRNVGLFGNLNGISISNSENFNITGSNITGNVFGIYSYLGGRNHISGNFFSKNRQAGLRVEGPSTETAINRGNVFSDNFFNLGEIGIEIFRSSGNSALKNILSNNTKYGIYLRSSKGTNVSLNNFSNSRVGLFLDTTSGNSIFCNYFFENSIDIDWYASSDSLENASCSNGTKFGGGNVTTSIPSPTTTSTAPLCSCTPWVSRGCEINGCPYGSEYSDRVCNPSGCATERTCILNSYCYSLQTTSTTLPQTTSTVDPATPHCPPECADTNPCTIDRCSNETGFFCTHEKMPEGFTCGAGLVCLANGTCGKSNRPCPSCPSPGEWSSCSLSGERTRTVYSCGVETSYYCVPYVERESCEPATPTTPQPTTSTAPSGKYCASEGDCLADEVCSNAVCRKAKLIIVFVPLDWNGGSFEFSKEVKRQAEFFSKNIPLSACPDLIKIVEAKDPCNVTLSCKYCGEAISIRNCAKRANPYLDIAVGLTDNSNLCRPDLRGFSCGVGGVFVKAGNSEVFAHEAGHEFGLKDEYCNYKTTCGSLANPNPLKREYGCDPLDTSCCWCSGSYSVCCHGNTNSFGGRSIMSYAGAQAPRAFDEPSLNHLRSLEKLRCS